MSTGWENHEPAPIEFLHGRMLDLFHEFREQKGEEIEVKMSGSDLVNIIAQAKMETYKKYSKQVSPEPILKTNM